MAPFTLSIEVLTAVLQEAEVSRVAVEFYGMKRPATQAWNKFADIVNYASHSSHSDEFKVLVDIGTYIVSNESELLTADKASCDVFGFKITENGVPRFDSKCLNFTIFLLSFKSCHLSQIFIFTLRSFLGLNNLSFHVQYKKIIYFSVIENAKFMLHFLKNLCVFCRLTCYRSVWIFRPEAQLWRPL
jgi:hypothetical protein